MVEAPGGRSDRGDNFAGSGGGWPGPTTAVGLPMGMQLIAPPKDDLRALPEISQVAFFGARADEIIIDLSEQALRTYGLTFEAVMAAGDDEAHREGRAILDAAAAPDRLIFNRTVGLRDTFAKAMASAKR